MGELALEEALYNQVCFHAHQAAEKALKARRIAAIVGDERTHSLTDLLTAGERLEPTLAGSGEGLDSLETYYIPARYPDAPPGSLPEGLPGREDAREALATARDVSDLVRQKVEEDG